MDREQALQRLKDSFSRGSKTPTLGNDAKEYLSQKSAELLQVVIDPVKAKVTRAAYPEYAFREYQASDVWAIARSADNWLLTLADKPEFALAWGDSSDDLYMHGFSSTDALAEWLG